MAGGRPLKFKTLKELSDIGDKYFKDTPKEEWTITGLALALKTSRETLINYEKREEFFDTISEYKLMVHNAYEISNRKRGNSGDIFALKNFGWADKTEHTMDVTTHSLFYDNLDDKAKKHED